MAVGGRIGGGVGSGVSDRITGKIIGGIGSKGGTAILTSSVYFLNIIVVYFK
jgi:hypothetical protein